MKNNNNTSVKVFEYNFNNNEDFPEDYMEFPILSLEKVPIDEFISLVEQIAPSCMNCNDLARKIVQKDERFFLPIRQSNISFGKGDEDRENKIRDVYYKF